MIFVSVWIVLQNCVVLNVGVDENPHFLKPSENQRLMKNARNFAPAPATTNWSNFGIYRVSRKALNADTHRVQTAGKPVFVSAKGLRLTARTKSVEPAIRSAIKWHGGVKPVVAVEPVKWTLRLVKNHALRTADGKVVRRVCKVRGSNGVQKVFITKKAAAAWVAKQK